MTDDDDCCLSIWPICSIFFNTVINLCKQLALAYDGLMGHDGHDAAVNAQCSELLTYCSTDYSPCNKYLRDLYLVLSWLIKVIYAPRTILFPSYLLYVRKDNCTLLIICWYTDRCSSHHQQSLIFPTNPFLAKTSKWQQGTKGSTCRSLCVDIVTIICSVREEGKQDHENIINSYNMVSSTYIINSYSIQSSTYIINSYNMVSSTCINSYGISNSGWNGWRRGVAMPTCTMHTWVQISEGVGQRVFLQAILRSRQPVATGFGRFHQLVHVYAGVVVSIVLIQCVVCTPVPCHLLLYT